MLHRSRSLFFLLAHARNRLEAAVNAAVSSIDRLRRASRIDHIAHNRTRTRGERLQFARLHPSFLLYTFVKTIMRTTFICA